MRSFIVYLSCSLIMSVALCAEMTAQHVFEADSVVLITMLDKENDLFYFEGEPYTGEAFFLSKVDGRPMVLRNYVDGEQEGIWRTWHSNGRLYKEGELKDGKEHGRYLEYYESGILHYEYFYDLGKKTGLWRSWYEDGDIYTERNFKEDVLDGRLVHYAEDGEVLVTEEYRKGYIIATTRNQKKRD